jgi:hypothetical protein
LISPPPLGEGRVGAVEPRDLIFGNGMPAPGFRTRDQVIKSQVIGFRIEIVAQTN